MAKTGTILLFAGNKVPKDWHWCDGTSMSISSNTPLFVTLRTEFGGDGARAFNLPKLDDKFGMRYMICINGDFATEINYDIDFSEDNFMGTVVPFTGNEAPKNWVFCDGKQLDYRSNDQGLCTVINDRFDTTNRKNYVLPNTGGEHHIICKFGIMP